MRYTVISAEQEMEFVRRALEDDADSTGVSEILTCTEESCIMQQPHVSSTV